MQGNGTLSKTTIWHDVAHWHIVKHSHEKLYLSLVSAPATRAVYQSDGCILGLCTCYPCSLPEFSPTMLWWFNMTLQVSSVMLCWKVLTLACPEIVPLALPCCLSYNCFGARCAWSNRFCIEFSVVGCFRLPTSFADLVFAMSCCPSPLFFLMWNVLLVALKTPWWWFNLDLFLRSKSTVSHRDGFLRVSTP